MPLDYRTTRGVLFSYAGWGSLGGPLACFDRGQWLLCLHACMLCLSLLNESHQTQIAIEDDGLLHELVHLASDIDICTHTSIPELRQAVADLQLRFELALTGGHLSCTW